MSGLSFESYNKIPESTIDWNPKNLNTCPWIVTEKVHGANFCIMYDGTTIACGKRKEILDESENFFGHKSILDSLQEKVKKIHEFVNSNKVVESVFVYGEIFGGKYPHDNVKPLDDVRAVQTGIWYSPKIEFYAFDIIIQGEDHVKDYLDYTQCIDLFKKVGMMYAEPLFVGKYEECLNYPFKFESTIPKKLGYPLIKGNLAEGIVIKPMKTMWAEGKKGKTRVILKIKPEEFQEKQFHEAEKWPEQQKETNFETSTYDLMTYEIYPFITDQRVENTISKIGTITKSNTDKLLTMYVEDVLESFLDEFQKQYDELSDDDKKKLRDLTKKEAFQQIKSYFKIQKE